MQSVTSFSTISFTDDMMDGTTYFKFTQKMTVDTFESCVIQWFNNLLYEIGVYYSRSMDMESFLEKFGGNCRGLQIHLDLREFKYIGLHETLMLLFLGEFLHGLTEHKVEVLLSTAQTTRGFLSAFGFFNHFHKRGVTQSRGFLGGSMVWNSNRILTITKIGSVHDVGEVVSTLKMGQVLRILQNNLPDIQVIRLSDIILSELCQNIPEHSRSRLKGYGFENDCSSDR